LLRQEALLVGAVEIASDGVAAAQGGVAVGLAAGGGDRAGDGAVLFLDGGLLGHGWNLLIYLLEQMYAGGIYVSRRIF
jgi:hypothetical protein